MSRGRIAKKLKARARARARACDQVTANPSTVGYRGGACQRTRLDSNGFGSRTRRCPSIACGSLSSQLLVAAVRSARRSEVFRAARASPCAGVQPSLACREVQAQGACGSRRPRSGHVVEALAVAGCSIAAPCDRRGWSRCSRSLARCSIRRPCGDPRDVGAQPDSTGLGIVKWDSVLRGGACTALPRRSIGAPCASLNRLSLFDSL
jgi:hypothetical protein